MRRTGTGLLEVHDFLQVKLDDLWLPVHKSSTSVRQRSGRCWHPAKAATGCEQNEGNLNKLRHKLQPWLHSRNRQGGGSYVFFHCTRRLQYPECIEVSPTSTWTLMVLWQRRSRKQYCAIYEWVRYRCTQRYYGRASRPFCCRKFRNTKLPSRSVGRYSPGGPLANLRLFVAFYNRVVGI